MPATNRATPKPTGDQAALQAQALEARQLEDALRGYRKPADRTQILGDVTVSVSIARWKGRAIRVTVEPDED